MGTADDPYFPFLDGALGYDCVRCGAKCCKGLGFSLGKDELVPLLLRRPLLAPFVQPRGDFAAVLDLSDEGCWFLRGDGRCGVELEDGRAHKPGTCRLFPFNRAHRIGAAIVVEPQLLRCPLEDARGQGVRHAELREELASVGAQIPWMNTAAPAGLPDDWVAREERLRDATLPLLDELDPMAVLLIEAPAVAARLRQLRAAWRAAFDLDPVDAARLDAQVARPLALVTPALRFASLFTLGGAPYPKLVAQLPALLLPGAFLSSLAARALGRAPSLRSLGEIHRATVHERALLGRWDRPASLRAGNTPATTTLPSPLDDAYARLVALLDGARPVGDAFTQAAADLPPSLRPVLLRALSDRFPQLGFA